MARTDSVSRVIMWIGGAIFAFGALVIGGFWVYAITTDEDMPVLILAGFLAVLVGLAVLLIAAIRDRIIQKKQENFMEVDH